MKRIIKQVFEWIFNEELIKLKAISKAIEAKSRKVSQMEERLKGVLGSLDVSVDVNMHYSPSWAVISIQGEREDFIKFIDLGRRDIHDIERFLRQFERSKVDCAPYQSPLLRVRKGGRQW